MNESELRPVVYFLELNNFKRIKEGMFLNGKCKVSFCKDGGYAVTDNKGATMYSLDNNIYWLIGVLTYYGHMNKHYKQL